MIVATLRRSQVLINPCMYSLRHPLPTSLRGISLGDLTSAIDGKGISDALLSASIETDAADGLAVAFDPELGGWLDLGEPAPEVAGDDIRIVAD